MSVAEEMAESFEEWEQIQTPSSLHMPSTSQSRDWEMVLIRENYLQDDLSVFPPSRHEGLQIHEQRNSPVSPSSSSSSAPLSSYSSSGRNVSTGDGSRRDYLLRVANDFGRHLRLHFRVLSTKVRQIAGQVRYYVIYSWSFRSFASVTGVVAALLLSLAYVKVQRWRRRVQEEKKNCVLLLLEEKDQKISQLMLQISQMNELLSARRCVPVIRIG